MTRRLAFAAVSLLALACEAVPEVDFRGDATTDGYSPNDGGSDGQSDVVFDAGPGCPDAQPPWATLCCNNVPCIGDCNGPLANGKPACDDCAVCGICCAKLTGGGPQAHVNVTCAIGTTCP